MTAAPAPVFGTLAAALLLTLAEEGVDTPVSLPRLGKRLQLGVSVLLRELTLMGSARIGPRTGPGWVAVEQDGERWRVRLTAQGADAARRIAQPAD